MSQKLSGSRMVTLYAGNSKELEFEVRKDGELVDLTDTTGKLKVFLEIPDTNETYIIDKTLTIPTQEDDALGTCSCTLSETETDQFPGVYRYYLVFTYDTDDDRVLQDGNIKIVGDDTDRINQIQNKYGLKYDYYTMREALNYAQSQLLNIGYEYVDEFIHTLDSNNCFKIDNYVMDKNFDEVVDSDDLYVFEYTSESPYTVTDLSSNISSVTFNHPGGFTVVEMDDSYPSASSYKLRVQYYRGLQTFSYLNNDIRYLEELLTVYHLFDILPIYKLQHGITKRDINGTKVEFNQRGIDDFKEKLRQQITYQISKIRSLDIKPIIINKDYGIYTNRVVGIDNSYSRYRNEGGRLY